MSYTVKTFDDEYGRHTLVYPEHIAGTTNVSEAPSFGRIDVHHLLTDEEHPQRIHPTRLLDDYQPRHRDTVDARNNSPRKVSWISPDGHLCSGTGNHVLRSDYGLWERIVVEQGEKWDR